MAFPAFVFRDGSATRRKAYPDIAATSPDLVTARLVGKELRTKVPEQPSARHYSPVVRGPVEVTETGPVALPRR